MSNFNPFVDEELTLRDYFAAAAINGLLSDPNVTGSAESWANTAYRVANAMLVERRQIIEDEFRWGKR